MRSDSCAILLILLASVVPLRSIRRTPCIDKNRNCAYWSRINQCAKNPRYMTSYCPRSCKICGVQSAKTTPVPRQRTHTLAAACFDKNKHCAYWSRNNECIRNARYMKFNCPRSCRVCGVQSAKTNPRPKPTTPISRACRDKHKYCVYWKGNNQCLQNYAYMKIMCRKSCGLCASTGLNRLKSVHKVSSGSGRPTTPNPISVTVTYQSTSIDSQRIPNYHSVSTFKQPYPTTVPYIPSTSPLHESVSDPVQCGRKALIGRIVGGKKAPPGSWPWQVGIKSCPDCKFFCGGTIVDKYWIVTAAHCVNDYQKEDLVIEAGVVDQNAVSSFKQTFSCEKIHVHKDYNVVAAYDKDIAVLKLNKSVIYNDHVRPLCLNKRKLRVNQQCIVTGFGKTSQQSHRQSTYLRQAAVPIVSRKNCTKAYQLSVPPRRVTSNMICAGYDAGEIDACGGDSGGPLNCYDIQNQRYILGGIVSWGVGCARSKQYGVYTDVHRLASWVKNIISSG